MDKCAKRPRVADEEFVIVQCKRGEKKCVRLAHLDVLCQHSDGLRWLIYGHPEMRKTPRNLDVFDTFGIEADDLSIMLHWAEHGCFKMKDFQLRRSMEDGRLRDAITTLGGGMTALLDNAAKACIVRTSLPRIPSEDVHEEYEWRVARLDTAKGLHTEGWVAGDALPSNSTHMFIHMRRKK